MKLQVLVIINILLCFYSVSAQNSNEFAKITLSQDKQTYYVEEPIFLNFCCEAFTEISGELVSDFNTCIYVKNNFNQEYVSNSHGDYLGKLPVIQSGEVVNYTLQLPGSFHLKNNHRHHRMCPGQYEVYFEGLDVKNNVHIKSNTLTFNIIFPQGDEFKAFQQFRIAEACRLSKVTGPFDHIYYYYELIRKYPTSTYIEKSWDEILRTFLLGRLNPDLTEGKKFALEYLVKPKTKWNVRLALMILKRYYGHFQTEDQAIKYIQSLRAKIDCESLK